MSICFFVLFFANKSIMKHATTWTRQDVIILSSWGIRETKCHRLLLMFFLPEVVNHPLQSVVVISHLMNSDVCSSSAGLLTLCATWQGGGTTEIGWPVSHQGCRSRVMKWSWKSFKVSNKNLWSSHVLFDHLNLLSLCYFWCFLSEHLNMLLVQVMLSFHVSSIWTALA